MISIQLILLIIFGLAAIWFGWRVFMTSSMVRSALSLLASMVAIGALFLVMEAEFLGVLQIMMMGTEMSIMAIFMMMYMMDPGGLGNMDMTHQKNRAGNGSGHFCRLGYHRNTGPVAPRANSPVGNGNSETINDDF